MKKLIMSVDGHIAEFSGSVSQVRRFLFHYDKVSAGEAQVQKRFAFDGAENGPAKALYIDIRKIQWLVVEDSAETAE